MVVIDVHLDVGTGIVFVGDGVVQYLTQSRFGHFQLLVALHSLEADRRHQVLGSQHVHHAVGHLDEVALDYILYQQVGLIDSETADLELYAGEELQRIFAEQQQRRILQVTIIVQQV